MAALVLLPAEAGAWRDSAMAVNRFETQFGVVVSQLLGYQYQALPPERWREGHRRAAASARSWIAAILSDDFQPPSATVDMFHDRDARSCDAVQTRYRVAGRLGNVEVRVSQTIFVIAVVVVPHGGRASQGAEHVAELARVLFRNSEGLNLEVDGTMNGFLSGRQMAQPPKSSPNSTWFDSLRWWSTGTTIGFTVTKVAGPGQAAKPSRDLQPNQVWFEMFERPRTR